MHHTLSAYLQSTGIVSAARAVEIAGTFTPKTLAANDFLLRVGKVSNEYLFLGEGLMRAYVHDTEGRDVTTGFYTAGNVVFEVASFFNRSPALENIRAVTDCEGLYISYEQLNTLFHTLPEFREFGRHMLVRGYAALKGRMLATITETAEVRYRQLLETAPQILQQVPLKHIASYLGITDTSLSRIRAGLSRK